MVKHHSCVCVLLWWISAPLSLVLFRLLEHIPNASTESGSTFLASLPVLLTPPTVKWVFTSQGRIIRCHRHTLTQTQSVFVLRGHISAILAVVCPSIASAQTEKQGKRRARKEHIILIVCPPVVPLLIIGYVSLHAHSPAQYSTHSFSKHVHAECGAILFFVRLFCHL